jgi:hypothetical protein
MLSGLEYTLSFWVRSDENGSVTFNGSTYSSSTDWIKHIVTFESTSDDLTIGFGATGTYYIYHTKLENGNTATDWTAAPEDIDEDIDNLTDQAWTAQQDATDAVNRVAAAEAAIQILTECIRTLVVNGDGGSLMTQTANGWVFNIGSYDDILSGMSAGLGAVTETAAGTQNEVNALNSTVGDIGKKTDYITIGTYNGQPCIELGEGDSDFKVRITNTEIQFIDGGTIPAYLSNQKLNIEKAEVKNELQFGNFVWKIRSNGNMGLTWNGGGS